MYTYVVIYIMLPRPPTFRAMPRTQLSSLHSADCSLLNLFSRSSLFEIRNLRFAHRTCGEPLLAKQEGWYAQYRAVVSPHLCQVVSCLLHTCKPSLFMGLQTLLRNGKPITPMVSAGCALF